MLFLGVANHALSPLMVAIKEFIAGRKISNEYNSQLERDQKEDLRKKIEDAGKQVDTALVNAYSTVLKFSVKNGLQTFTVKQFRETLDGQINNNVFDALKTEEWLLDKVGLGTLRTNNLLPTVEQSIKVKDVYEAFIRFDDKPMITDAEAVKASLIKYCFEGQICIAAGDGKEFTKYYLKENVPFLDVGDSSYWLLDKSLKPAPAPIDVPGPTPPTPPTGVEEPTTDPSPVGGIVKEFENITISGSVPLDRYTELFNYFIKPFAMNGNKVDIEVSFKIKASESSPLTEAKQHYKSAKEAAKQLGLKFEEKPK